DVLVKGAENVYRLLQPVNLYPLFHVLLPLLLWYLNKLADLLPALGGEGDQQSVPLHLSGELPGEDLPVPDVPRKARCQHLVGQRQGLLLRPPALRQLIVPDHGGLRGDGQGDAAGQTPSIPGYYFITVVQ